VEFCILGDNVIIGSNTAVILDIRSNSIALGSPVKIIKSNINYDDYILRYD
jgi:acetyltransferase-like isoleucine patch superfamily enzyme